VWKNSKEGISPLEEAGKDRIGGKGEITQFGHVYGRWRSSLIPDPGTGRNEVGDQAKDSQVNISGRQIEQVQRHS
jgi:hypothetical protein